MNFLNIKNKLKSIYFVEIILILIGIIFRLKLYLYNQAFFMDECALGINLINRTYSDLLFPLDYMQCAPPFFMMTCKFFLDISHQYGHLYRQDLAIRFYPFICSVLSLPLFAILLNKISKNNFFVWLGLAMLAFNNCAISYAVQFKQYSCELMFSIILLLIFHDFNINISNKKLLLYTIIICLSIWFSNTAIFLIIAGVIYSLITYFNRKNSIENRTKLLKLISVIFVAFIINSLIYYYFFFELVYMAQSDFMHNFWENEFLKINLYPRLIYKFQDIIKIPILLMGVNIFLLLNIFILFKRKDIENKAKFFIIFPILFAIIVSLMKAYPFYQRFILYLLPMLIMFYCQLTYFANFLNKKVIDISKILLIIFIFILFILKIKQPAREQVVYIEPTRAAAEFVIQNNIPLNKIIIIHDEYYSNIILKKNKPLYSISIWNFKPLVDIPYYLKNIPKGDYYFINTSFVAYHSEQPPYVENLTYFDNKNFKILNTYSYDKPEKVYIVHFEKISNY